MCEPVHRCPARNLIANILCFRCRSPSRHKPHKFEADGATKEVATQICLSRPDPVQLRAQKINEPAKIRIVVQRDPFSVNEVLRQLRRARGPIEIQPFGHHEEGKRGP
jgi:hypothetical protein